MKKQLVKIEDNLSIDERSELTDTLPTYWGRYSKGKVSVELVTTEDIHLPSVFTQIKTEADNWGEETGEDITVQLIWIPTRSEWIGYKYGQATTFESLVRGHETYPIYGKAYRITTDHAKDILEAYGIPDGIIPLEKVLHTSPDELEELVRQAGNKTEG